MVEDVKSENLSNIVIKNSGYMFLSNLILKFGGLIFTIIIARILLPELFGIYSLVLSIITIFIVFANLGIDDTLLRYSSLFIGKNNISKARSYFRFLFKIKILVVLIVVLFGAILSKVISYNIYENPLLFYPLIFACLFLIMESFWSFFATFFLALKELRITTILNLFLQIFKISFSMLALVILSDPFKVSGLFIAAFISEAIVLFVAFLILYKKNKELFFGPKTEINRKDKKKIFSFLTFMGIANVSLAIFGSIDILMLGKFVDLQYLGYYRVSLSLVLAVASLASLSSVLLPIFTQISGKRFNRGFHKTLRYLLILSVPATMGVMFLSKYLIKAFYGDEYLMGTMPIYFLSMLIIITPLIGLYSVIFQSKEKPKVVSNSILISLLINIVLNFLVISLFKGNHLFIISGVGLATSLSRVFLLGILVFQAKRIFNFRVRGIGLRAPIFATVIMSLFLVTFNYFVDMNIWCGILEVILGAGIYFIFLILFKGVTKEDFKLIKGLFNIKQVN